MHNRPPKLAVIDDGINEGVFSAIRLTMDLEVTTACKVVQRICPEPGTVNHSTLCAALICNYVDRPVELISIKVLDREQRGMHEQLLCALYWCLDNNIDLINLSLGTIYFREFRAVKKAVDALAAHNSIVVAAGNNEQMYTCPASFDSVIGVKCDRDNNLAAAEYTYWRNSPDGIQVTACGNHTLPLSSPDDCMEIGPSNSFAAPVITAKIYDMLAGPDNLAPGQVRKVLQKEASLVKTYCSATEDEYWNSTNVEETEIDIPLTALFDLSRGHQTGAAEYIRSGFLEAGYYCVISPDAPVTEGPEGLAGHIRRIIKMHSPDIILLDFALPGKTKADLALLDSLYPFDIRIVIEERQKRESAGLQIKVVPDYIKSLEDEERCRIFSSSDTDYMAKTFSHLVSLLQ